MAYKDRSKNIFLHKPYTSILEDSWKMETPALETDNTIDFQVKNNAKMFI